MGHLRSHISALLGFPGIPPSLLRSKAILASKASGSNLTCVSARAFNAQVSSSSIVRGSVGMQLKEEQQQQLSTRSQEISSRPRRRSLTLF